MLSGIMTDHSYAECIHAKCRYAECIHAKCRYAECCQY
jgi:hypothetical protein